MAIVRALGGLPLAVPVRAAVIVPAVKLPEPSRRTMALVVLAEVAAFAKTAPELTSAAVVPPTVTTVASTEPGPSAVTSPARSVI